MVEGEVVVEEAKGGQLGRREGVKEGNVELTKLGVGHHCEDSGRIQSIFRPLDSDY